MGLQIRRVTQTKYKLLFASLAIMTLAVQPLYGFVASRVANAVSSAAPSTNEINRIKGWAHANEASKTETSVSFDFVSTRKFPSCFEYRSDGDTSQKTSDTNPNTEVEDGKYPFKCVNNSTESVTVSASKYVEVRMVFGSEKNERFDWTKFNVAPDTTDPTVTSFVQKFDKVDKNGLNREKVTLTFSEPVDGSSITGGQWNGSEDTFTKVYYTTRNHVIFFKDLAGNLGSYTFSVDATNPNISKVIVNGETMNGQYKHNENCSPINKLLLVSGSVDLTAVSTDNSNVQSVKYKVKKLKDNGCTDTATYSSGNVSLKQSSKNTNNWNQQGVFDTSTISEDGKYAVVLTSTDDFGNKTTKYVHLDVDNTAPKISINSFDGNDKNDAFREVSLGYHDAKKVAYAQFNGDKIHDFSDAVWSNTDNVWANRSWTGVVEGKNTVDLYDVAGNKSTYTFIIDHTAPKVDLQSAKNDDGSVNIVAAIKDDNLSHYWLSVWKDGQEYKIPGAFTTKKTDEFDIKTLLNITEAGDYVVKLEASDKAGNKSGTKTVDGDSVKTISFTSEGVAPVVPDDDTTTPPQESTTDPNQGTGGPTGLLPGEKLTIDGVDDNMANPLDDPQTSNVNSIFNRNFALNLDANDEDTATDQNEPQTDTLGDSIANAANGEDVKGAADEKAQSGLAWYWWALLVAAVAAIWWWIAAARKRNQDA